MPDRAVDDGTRALRRCHGIVAGLGVTPCVANRVHDLVGGFDVDAGAVAARAQVVDEHARTLASQSQRGGFADTVSGTSDDRYFRIEKSHGGTRVTNLTTFCKILC
jgi:hypothetical protein